MRAGTLRRRVTIQEQVSTQDASGQPVDTWNPIATNPTVWASVEDLSGKEALRDGAFTAQITTTVTMRYRSDLKSGMRIVDGTRTLEIAAPPIDKDGRRRALEILCKEIAP